MIPAVSQSATLNASIADEFEALDGIGLELWLTKVEQFIQTHSLAELERLVEQHKPKLVAAALQGGLWQAEDRARETAWELFRSRLELCRKLDVPVLVVAADLAAPFSAQDVDRIVAWWRQAGEMAQAYSVHLALECQASAVLANNLLSLGTLVAQTNHSNVGWCLDLFHFFIGPSQTEDLSAMPADRLYHVQLCDLLDCPRETATDRDRILPGDGTIPIEPVVEWLEATGYAAAVSVELFHPPFWELPAVQVISAAKGALERTLRS